MNRASNREMVEQLLVEHFEAEGREGDLSPERWDAAVSRAMAQMPVAQRRRFSSKRWALAAALSVLALAILVDVGRAGMHWLGSATGALPGYNNEQLVQRFPLIVEGTLTKQGHGILVWRNWLTPYDQYRLDVYHVWAGDEQVETLSLTFPRSRIESGIGVEHEAHVDPDQAYVFFLEAESSSGGLWAGMRPISDNQFIWQVERDRIIPTVRHLREMTKAELASLIASRQGD